MCVSVQDLFLLRLRLFSFRPASRPLLLALPSTLHCSHTTSPAVLSLFHQSVVLCDALSSELFQDVVEVSGVGEAVACQVGAKLGLMVDLEDVKSKKSVSV